MILTHHWSASGPSRIREYHVEYALKSSLSSALHQHLVAAKSQADVNWIELRAMFDVWKNVDLATPTDYGTWHMNHDPRDGSANVEIGALCMGGERVTVAGPWGSYPFTIAHAWMGIGIGARVAAMKNLDANASFEAPGFQNGPLHVISTHAERAIQTPDSAATLRPSYGYFAYSGDGDCRWDLSARDAGEASVLATPAGAYASALKTAAWIRAMTHEAKSAGIHDFWGLDGSVAA
jgi:hypothetical protein